MADTTVHVKNISPQTGEKDVRDFFSFCGKISNLTVADGTDGTKFAEVTFEKPTAAKTALLLDNTQLGPNLVHVSSTGTLEEMTSPKAGAGEHDTATGEDLAQEDKPRSRIVAEYLAHGYTISDKAIERAISLDNQHGISARFTAALSAFDNKYGATEKTREMDTKLGASEKAAAGWRTLNSYFEKAIGTPTGQKVRDFYLAGNKQVMDVHTEARRLANMKDGKSAPEFIPGTGSTSCGCNGDASKCGCAGGQCACSTCPKNAANTSGGVEAGKAPLETIPGSEKTKCSCGGDTGICSCEPGKCACADCPKNPAAPAPA